MAIAIRLIYRIDMDKLSRISIRGLVLDMDGVIWKDIEPIGNLPEIFDTIKKRDIKFVFATNNATKSSEDYVSKLKSLGVAVDISQIINSAMAMGYLLKQYYPQGGPVYIIGESGLKNTLKKAGFYEDDKDPLAVVVGLDKKITYEMLSKATLLIRSGKKFFGTNPDKTYPMPAGLVPGAGAIITTVEVSTDTKPEYAGKPASAMFQMALERLGTIPDETLAVGDRLETDLAGGQRIGMRTAVVLSGVATKESINAWKPAPDFVAQDLAALLEMIG
jgi:4-nitrophenyl phosphatase